MAKRKGHSCRVCGRIRANEKFSGKGHARHVCKDCEKEDRARRSTERQARRLARAAEQLRQDEALTRNAKLRTQGRECFDRFFARWPNPALRKDAERALCFLASADDPMEGGAAEWSAGLLHALGANPLSLMSGLSEDEKAELKVSQVPPVVVLRRAEQARALLELPWAAAPESKGSTP